MKKEIWIQMINYNHNYFISNHGNIKNSSGLILKQRYDKFGYKRISLYIINNDTVKLKTFFIHRFDHLRVFGCQCYPNFSATIANKLSPRSTLCVFLGYSSEHKGYRCLDMSSNRVIISRYVTFDENSFPFGDMAATSSSDDANLDFLLDMECSPLPIGPCFLQVPPGPALLPPLDHHHGQLPAEPARSRHCRWTYHHQCLARHP